MLRKIINSKNTRDGLSLLELLIYIAIFSILMVAIAGLFTMILRTRSVATARFEVQENTRVAVEEIKTALRSAAAVSVSGMCPLNMVSVQRGAITTIYQIMGGSLVKTAGSNPSENITTSRVTAEANDSTCLWTRIANPVPARATLQIMMKIRYNDGGKPELRFEDVIQTSISLR